ncbi:AmpE protein, partial [Pseudomonas syringae pv. actinidiae ICMP 18804]
EVPPPVIGTQGVTSLYMLWELLVRAAIVWYAGFALWTLLR